MKLIKKYWLAIAAAIAGIVGFILLNNNKSKSVKAINKEIDPGPANIGIAKGVNETSARVSKST